MRTIRRAGLTFVACLALVTGAIACASSPPDSAISTASPESADLPATASPDGTVAVTTGHRTMVIEDGERPPQLCVGGVQESLPPNCSGVELIGWNWDALDGAYDERGRMDGGEVERGPVRWGEFTVTGDYSRDDNTLTVTHVGVEGDAHGADEVRECVHVEERAEDMLPAEVKIMKRAWSYVEEDLGIAVFAGGSDSPCAGVSILVAYDDGSIQAEVDDEFGDGAVRVASALALRG